MMLLVCLGLGAKNATAQAAAEYGGVVAGAGISASRTQPAMPSTQSNAHLPALPTEDLQAANRKALESRAGKNAAKLMLRSEPSKAWVRIGGKPVGRTPMLLIVAPGVYMVEMEGTRMESGRQQVDLLPKETRQVVLALQARYPNRVRVQWDASQCR